MAQHIDKIEVEVSGLDAGIQVQRFDLAVAVNDIPRLTLEILPVKSRKGQTEASAPTFSEITDLYHKLFSKSLDLRQKASVTIRIDSKDKGCKKQSIQLKNWILTDVGLSSVTTYSAPSLIIILQHPIVNLSRTGAVYETPMNNINSAYEKLSGRSMISLMDDLYKRTSSKIFPFYPLPESVSSTKAKAFREALGKPENLPGTYLDAKGGLFLEKQADEAVTLLKVALARIMQPYRGSVSTWYTVISKICPYCLMHVRPTYDQEKLSLEPLQPWYGANAHKIDENLIESIDLVARDPDPVCGTSFARVYPGEPTFSTATLSWRLVDQNGTDTKFSSYAFNIPDKKYVDNSSIEAARSMEGSSTLDRT